MKYDTWNILISRINAIWLLNMLMLESCLKGQIGKLAFLSDFSTAFKTKITCVLPLAMFSHFGRVQLYFKIIVLSYLQLLLVTTFFQITVCNHF